MLLHTLFEQTARRQPDKVALVAGATRASYREIDGRSARLAAWLQRHGVRRGDRVACYLENGIDMVVALYAGLRCGAVVMPINPLTRRDKLAYLLNDAGASALLTEPSLCSEAAQALSTNRCLHTCRIAGGDAPTLADPRCVVFDDTPGAPDDPGPLQEPGTIDVDLAVIVYTSGSTGEPKGVMLSHLNMVSAAASVSSYLGLREGDVIGCALPLAFNYGLYQVLMAFRCGATVVLERSFAFPARAMRVMSREGVTVFPGVPTMFTLLLNLRNLAELAPPSLRLITNTAAALTVTQIRQLRTLFPRAKLYSMYGLTECKRVSYLPPEQLDVRPASVGKGMPNEELWLVDDHGQRLPNGSTGELVIRGSHVMRGYWGKPAETAERLKPGPLPGEMVLHSGDIFRTDEEGWLYFVARKDDVIKSRGEKVSPREVENVLCDLEGVYEAAVVGVDDDVLGQAVKAFVVLKPGCAHTPRDVIRHCVERLESFMAPKYVAFVDVLPRTDTGKIKKADLA
jgi:long-chain acyl-CoA synthetase